MVSIAVLGTVMVGGMGVGILTNAGLSSGEINEKCKMINELTEQIEQVKKQTKELLDKFHKEEEEVEGMIEQTKKDVDLLTTKIDEMKKKNKIRLDREEFIYFSIVVTIILILLVKMILSIFFKDKIN
tara:strand:- start:10929 stop:11312 length:384 start_codon:yes stop_codon:yes gene_type:complete